MVSNIINFIIIRCIDLFFYLFNIFSKMNKHTRPFKINISTRYVQRVKVTGRETPPKDNPPPQSVTKSETPSDWLIFFGCNKKGAVKGQVLGSKERLEQIQYSPIRGNPVSEARLEGRGLSHF